LRRRQVSVVGAGSCDAEVARLAEEVGRQLAANDVTIVCGGLGGVMEAASRGAARAGGAVIGIVPTNSTEPANPHCTHVVAAGIGEARNLAVVASGELVIAIGGAFGTLSGIGFARKLGRPVIALNSWELRLPDGGDAGLQKVDTADGAVAEALRLLG
jgi:uncharacterized protein (TIGR00725 family)